MGLGLHQSLQCFLASDSAARRVVRTFPATTTVLHPGATLTAGFPFLQSARPTTMTTVTTWQWQRCGLLGCNNVPSVAGQPTKYLVSSADLGSSIQVVVTVSNSDGSAPGSGVNTGTGTSLNTKVVN